LLADTKDWYDDAIGTIHARDIQACLDLIRGGDDDYKPRPYLANLLHARMKAFFAWCAKPNIGKIAVSPMLGIDKPFADTKRRERPWFKEQAADAAIKSIWFAADTIGGVEGKYLKTLLLTGKRRTALAEMRWEQIKQTDHGWFWAAPPGRKNKRVHSAPLSNLVQRILHPRQDSGFVFPGSRDGRINAGTSLTRSIINAGAPADFFLHSLRHIAESKLAELKIPAQIRDRLFDHAEDRGSGSVYDHATYETEMRSALETWADHIARLVQPAEGVKVLR
jgi:integrase